MLISQSKSSCLVLQFPQRSRSCLSCRSQLTFNQVFTPNVKQNIDYKQKQFHTSLTAYLPKRNNVTANASDTSENFVNIYIFKYITHARAISRFKIYQTFVTVAIIPLSMFSYDNGLATLSDVYYAISLSGFAMVMLAIMSRYFQRIVGILGINDTGEKIKISHLTFWGRRNDAVYDVAEIVPFTDSSDHGRITFFDRREEYHLFLNYSKELNLKSLERVFGKLTK